MGLRFPSAIPGLVPVSQGKTRDMFALKANPGGQELMLIVATDRLSTHNIVHDSLIPEKGAVLTALTVHWLTNVFSRVGIRHHLVASGREIYKYIGGDLKDYPSDLHLRGIVVRKLTVLPIEFIFRARLGGSLFEKFYSKGLPNPYGLKLQSGLQLMSQFPEPIFTPTEKSETDDPLNADDVLRKYPAACALARNAFLRARNILLVKGTDTIDGKLEVAIDADGDPVLVDEIITPDSSRFCESNSIVLGSEPPYLDKQIARDEAVKMWGKGTRCPLTFSSDLVYELTRTYLRIFARITGWSLEAFQEGPLNY